MFTSRFLSAIARKTKDRIPPLTRWVFFVGRGPALRDSPVWTSGGTFFLIHLRPNRRIAKQDNPLRVQMIHGSVSYTPEIQHGTWKWWVSHRNLLFQGSIFRFHVCFGGEGNSPWTKPVFFFRRVPKGHFYLLLDTYSGWILPWRNVGRFPLKVMNSTWVSRWKLGSKVRISGLQPKSIPCIYK